MFSCHSACASVVFKEAEDSETINPPYSPEDDDGGEYFRQLRERIPQKRADISRCWIKYCVELLKSSRDKLLKQLNKNNEREGEDSQQNGSQGGENGESQSQTEGAVGGDQDGAEVSDVNLVVEGKKL